MARDNSARATRKPISGSPLAAKLVIALSVLLALQLLTQQLMALWSSKSASGRTGAWLLALSGAAVASVDVSWYPPNQTAINSLSEVVNGTGVYGFIYDTSDTPAGEYGTYNWCNMPHVRKTEYVVPSSQYQLVYVELSKIHRHHKRTPYASNSFPVESYLWNCNDEGLYFYGQPFDGSNLQSAEAYWQGYISPINPFVPSGWIGTCQFPQITSGGLDDSWQHGQDLWSVYHDLLGFLPGRDDAQWQSKATYRVTQNVITSQVAGMVINGMWGVGSNSSVSVPLIVEASGVDSLEPTYPCSAGSNLFSTIQSSANPAWQQHLTAAAPLYATLDAISGVAPSDGGFHASFDHYYDNLSARQCHAKPLPCKLVAGANSSDCVTQPLADEVYRFGNWEYSQTHRDAPQSLAAGAATFGVWVAELAAHLRAAVAQASPVLWYHNIAHDGSVSRLLAVLQVDVMVWPGMGSEVVFELWRDRSSKCRDGAAAGSSGGSGGSSSGYYLRALWGGRVLNSSSPTLGSMDMVPVETVLAYFDGLVGVNASLVTGNCN